MSTTEPTIAAEADLAGDPAAAGDELENGFSKSILVSAVRCTLTYVVLPFLTPLIGLASDIGPVLGLTLGTVALAANGFSIRRFWKADHKWKRQVTVLHVGVIILLTILFFQDLGDLLG